MIPLAFAAAFPLTGPVAMPEPPGCAELIHRMEKMPPHPRLFLRPEQVRNRLREQLKTSMGEALAGRLRADADILLKMPPSTRLVKGRRLLEVSRRVLLRVTTLTAVWLFTGERCYADRALLEMEAAARFSDWNPSHFLDTAEMTAALAIGYDWLYPLLSERQRTEIGTAILEKGLLASWPPRQAGWWVNSRNNWSQVCHAGMVLGALAVAERDLPLAAKTIRRALVQVPATMLRIYAPNGAYAEGPGYWAYGTEFNALLIAALESALGSDFGLLSVPGFNRTGEFIAATVAPTGKVFNYADCAERIGIEFARIWWANRFRRPDCFHSQIRRQFFDYTGERLQPRLYREDDNLRLMPLALLYLDNLVEGSSRPPRSYFSGAEAETPIAVHRSSGEDDALYLGVKAGSPGSSHGHMDGGSFLIEADGVRWTCDLGINNYAKIEKYVPDLWQRRPHSGRYRVFRIGRKSHNILLIDDHDQRVDARATITEFSGDDTEQHTVVDLSPLYRGDADLVERRAALLPERVIEISDQLEGVRPGARVRWQMCTKANPVLHGAVAELRKEGKRMRLIASGSSPLNWQVVRAECLTASFEPREKGTFLLFFETVVPEDGALRLKVRFFPESALPRQEKK